METKKGLGTARRRQWRVVAAGALTAALVVLSACGGSGGSSSEQGAASTEVTVGLPEEPRTLASWNAYSNDGHPILRNVGEALLNRDPKSNDLVPELALSYKQVDPLNWRFTLRQGVKFHDGTPFNAQAAADSLNYVLDPENAFPMRTFLGPDVKASAVDEYTLNIKTTAADPILPTRLYFVTIPSPAQLTGDPQSYETTPIGTGPYKFVSWARGQNIVLEANPDWWGKGAEDAMGSQQVTKATYLFRPETEVRAGMVERGEADLVPRLTADQCEGVPKCESTATVETIILRLDTPDAVFKDERVRKAVAMSFDKAQIMTEIVGAGDPTGQIVGPSATGYADLPPYPYDPEQAKQLIQQAKADGVDVTAPITVTAREGFIVRANEIIQVIAEGMKAIGLTGAKTQMLETAAFEEQWTIGYKKIPATRGWAGLQQHGQELMDYSGSIGSYYSCTGQTSAYCDEDLEKMYQKAASATGSARQTQLAEIAKYVYDKAPVIPIGQPKFNFGLTEQLTWKPRMDGFILLKEMTLSS